MSELVRFEEVTKTYRTARGRRLSALDRFSMTIPQGRTVGLLGPNGSGKTTALKALLGLVRPDSGTIHAFGHLLPHDQRHVAAHMGALIEGPAFTPSLTGRHNLRLTAQLLGAPTRAVDEALELVGLEAAADRRYAGYSLGMKQRLGVAAAFLGRPDLLVLDEPMNGLDPEAVRDMRGLFGRLREEFGMTMVVSSHILAEVEQVSDRVTIVRDGRCIADADLTDLLAEGGPRLVLRVDDPGNARAALLGHGYHTTTRTGPRGTELRLDATAQGPDILKILTSQGIYPHEMSQESPDLEDVYVAAIRAATTADPQNGEQT
ncbi:ATP-binding cassette domain-containing protein [Embleya sp. NPDC056575]|uniref:ATP-binding cassette domain-containing protein n=1 Tax=unclassified Embleya TaxID=2699296 RepID=UPI00368625AA